MYESFQWFY